MNRREFVALTVAGACACCAHAAEPATQPASRPTSRPASRPAGALDAGALADYAEDGAYDTFGKSHKVLIIRHEGKLYAASATCTHKKCTVKALSRTELRCPCHGSAFDLHGVPAEGPARAPLFRYAIQLKDKKVFVNTKRQFVEKDWNKPAAFIKLA
jgi:nitrite reductase/ring-hydroxylating ferredoxin subunit